MDADLLILSPSEFTSRQEPSLLQMEQDSAPSALTFLG